MFCLLRAPCRFAAAEAIASRWRHGLSREACGRVLDGFQMTVINGYGPDGRDDIHLLPPDAEWATPCRIQCPLASHLQYAVYTSE